MECCCELKGLAASVLCLQSLFQLLITNADLCIEEYCDDGFQLLQDGYHVSLLGAASSQSPLHVIAITALHYSGHATKLCMGASPLMSSVQLNSAKCTP